MKHPILWGLTCDDIEAEVIEIPDSGLIKIMNGREIERSPSKLVFKGLGIYSSNMDGVETRYRG